ncbi:serine protease inhibitor 42Dd-like [Drosophila ficusphila]|uniref:serine protease inhibitor 42Dd-like n=1 Tax=Drosophila ficusphila TaxID=30025 RepID=UPI0007E88AE7|nr:serine protease inhibitor 42Dd-like [Drosophila ficusphila]
MRLFFLVILATSVTARFTDDFYQLLAEKNADKNLISSPLSVEIAMSMAYIAARGKTVKEIAKVLNVTTDNNQLIKKYKDFLTKVVRKNTRYSILNLANRIFVNDNYKLITSFNETFRDAFKAESPAINFRNPDEAASIVNKWVANQTLDRTHDIVKSEDMDPDLMAVFVNANYFKSHWYVEFDPKNTKTSDFRITDQNRVPVQMMSQKGPFRAEYFEDLDAKVIELAVHDYDNELAILIFLPEKIDGLMELEKKIRGFSRYIGLYEGTLELPKFKIEYSEDLKSILQTMGIRSAFSSADFIGLEKPGNMKVLHKDFIEVNEEGDKAFSHPMLPPVIYPPRNVTVDHPFAYIVQDVRKTIYFQGHVVNPGA